MIDPSTVRKPTVDLCVFLVFLRLKNFSKKS